jgi:hypothetical protein
MAGLPPIARPAPAPTAYVRPAPAPTAYARPAPAPSAYAQRPAPAPSSYAPRPPVQAPRVASPIEPQQRHSAPNWARTVAGHALDLPPRGPDDWSSNAMRLQPAHGSQVARAMPPVVSSSPVQLDLVAPGIWRGPSPTAEVPELRAGWGRGGPTLVLIAAAIALAMVLGATLTRLGRQGAAPIDDVQPVVVAPAPAPVARRYERPVVTPIVQPVVAPAPPADEAAPAAREVPVEHAPPTPVARPAATQAHHHHRHHHAVEGASDGGSPRTVKQGRLVDPFSE